MLNFFSLGKRFASALFALLLCLPAPGFNVRAQEPAEPAEPPARQGAGGRGPNLMQRLNLSREQRLRLREIRRQSEPELRDLARRQRLARRALDEAIYADAADETLVEQRSRELAVLQNSLTHLRAATEMKVRRVLTDEQLQLFRKLRLEAQQRQMLLRRMNRARRQSARPRPDGPGASAPADTQPRPPASDAPPARRRRP